LNTKTNLFLTSRLYTDPVEHNEDDEWEDFLTTQARNLDEAVNFK
jgi:hypothetical protein